MLSISSDIKLRVINDVQQAVFRVFLHPEGVPMVMDGKVTPNLNNRYVVRAICCASDGPISIINNLKPKFKFMINIAGILMVFLSFFTGEGRHH